MFTVGAFAIIFDHRKRVLLCHRRDFDLWNLPGGRVEKREAPWAGIVREVNEETGLDVQIKKLIGIYFKPNKNELVFSFLCNIQRGRIHMTDEANKIDFFRYDDLPKNISKKQKERIKDALDNLKRDQVILKIQRGPSSIELLKKKWS